MKLVWLSVKTNLPPARVLGLRLSVTVSPTHLASFSPWVWSQLPAGPSQVRNNSRLVGPHDLAGDVDSRACPRVRAQSPRTQGGQCGLHLGSETLASPEGLAPKCKL